MGLSFLVPAFLAGLAALAVPVWIHLRNRRRARRVDFPSLMFLRRIPTRSVQRRELRYRALLALRCLAFVLLAVAFARPFLPGADVAATVADTARERVLLVDRSWSMGYGDRWERAREAVRDALGDWRQGDRVSLVTFDEEAEVTVGRAPEPGAVEAALADLEPGDAGTRFDAGLGVAQRILTDSDLPGREILLVSDYQQVGWEAPEVPDMPEGTRLVPVDLSGASTNLSVADVVLRRRLGPDQEGDTVGVTARLTRQTTAADAAADAEPRSLAVNLEIDGSNHQRLTAELPANGATAVSFDPVPVGEEAVRGTVRMPPDSLAGDNELHFVVVPGQVLPVLILESAASSDTDSLYLSRALEAASRPAIRVERRGIRGVDAAALEGVALVVLNDVGVPSPSIAAALRDWVAAGGGLWIALGELSSDDGWPEVAHELLPAGFGDPVDRSGELGATLATLDTDHPALELFAGPDRGDFGDARFYRYRPLRPVPTEGVLARFDDGGVALAEHRLGEGRVLVWTSTLDTFWNDLPLQPVYLPLVHGLARYVAGYVEPSPWLDSGRPLSARTLAAAVGASTGPGDPAAGVALEVTDADGVSRRLSPTDGADTVRLSPGFADVAWDGGEAAVAANLHRGESDLATIDPEEVASAVTWRAGAGAGERDEARGTRAELVERRQAGWWYLLVVAFALLAAETALSNRLSRHAS